MTPIHVTCTDQCKGGAHLGSGHEVCDDGVVPVANRFKAFISYSHADKAAAQKLHRKLETYRLPKNVRQNASGIDGDGRVGAIFRDREDLPAAEDLTESVKLALSGSEALLVLCSPSAKKSPWVAREIELFRELHPERPVLAALITGKPDDAFPAPLRDGREPLAADLRKEGDGPRLGFLKIVAGITRVPLDSLVNRDAQRRVRRVTAITVAALAAMVVMALMTTFAIQQRNEAQKQREGAEGLVEYLLTDLRNDLEGVGRLDVMGGVNERALNYFDGLGDASSLSDQSLALNARVLHKIGQDELSLKDRDMVQAKAIFDRAYEMTEALMARDADNGDRIFNHAQSAYWVGDLFYRQHKWPEAEVRWSEYYHLAATLSELDPDNSKWQLERGYALGNLCTLALHRKDKVADSLGLCRNALLEVKDALADAPGDPGRQAAVANRLGWLGDAQTRAKDNEEAFESYSRQHEILLRLFNEDRKNVARADQLMRAKMTLAEFLSSIGQFEKSQEIRGEARTLATKMVQLDPSNYWWAKWLERIDTPEDQKER